MKGEMKEYIPKAEMEKAYKIALAKLTQKKNNLNIQKKCEKPKISTAVKN